MFLHLGYIRGRKRSQDSTTPKVKSNTVQSGCMFMDCWSESTALRFPFTQKGSGQCFSNREPTQFNPTSLNPGSATQPVLGPFVRPLNPRLLRRLNL